MGRKIFKSLIMVGLLTANPAFALMEVIDHANIANMGKAITEAQNQVQKLGAMHQQLNQLNDVLGGKLDLASMDAAANQWSNVLSHLSYMGGDPISALYWLGGNGKDYTNLISTGDYFAKKLFPTVTTPHSFSEMNALQQNRIEVLQKSSTYSFAISNKHKQDLETTQKQIVQLGKEGVSAQTVLEALTNQNKLLSLIATQQLKQTELLSQQLELIASLATGGLPMTQKQKVKE